MYIYILQRAGIHNLWQGPNKQIAACVGLRVNAMSSEFKEQLFMCFQFEFQRRYKLSGAGGMVTDMTLLQNAEFKEAFDEFDKVLTISL